MKGKMIRREDDRKLIHMLSQKGEVRGAADRQAEDACAIAHTISSETYLARMRFWKERQICV